jgi:hypothetical protein
MIYHASSILCEQILTNPRNNSLSYINTIHDNILKTPIKEGAVANLRPFIVATKWFKDSKIEEKMQVRVSAGLIGNDEEIIIGETDVVLDKDSYVIALNMEVIQLPVKNEGLYIIKVEHKPPRNKKWKEGALLPLRVVGQNPKTTEEEQKQP